MIKRYFEFIKEHSHDNQSIGEWVEELYNDDYIKNINEFFFSESVSAAKPTV